MTDFSESLKSLYDNTLKAYESIDSLSGETFSEARNLANLSSAITKALEGRTSEITVKFTLDGTVTVHNLWEKPILVNGEALASGQDKIVPATSGKEMTIEESEPDVFRHWISSNAAFISGTKVKLDYMPKMSAFTLDKEGKFAGKYFFNAFNAAGSIVEFPAGSFDTSEIELFGDEAFSKFNRNGTILTTLPEGSFNFDSCTAVGYSFCWAFNQNGSISSLPEGSFNTEKITTNGGGWTFENFNRNGKITKLPAGSFRFDSLTDAGDEFLQAFNQEGLISILPKDSFNTDHFKSVGTNFMYYFNNMGGRLRRNTSSYVKSKNLNKQATTEAYWNGSTYTNQSVAPNAYYYWEMES